MAVTAFSSRLRELLEPDAAVERLATGFLFTEGPLWHPTGHYLLFSDLAGDVIRRWGEQSGAHDFRRPSGKANGLAWDRQGRLVACEHVGRRVTRTETDGTVTVLASAYHGTPLNSPNDLVVKSDGAIFFTDPPYGLQDYYGIARAQDLPFQGVYRLGPDGALRLLVDDFAAPNGLCFSPEEALLYVDDTERQHIRVFDVRGDGTLANGRLFFDFAAHRDEGPGAPDGMKLDRHGNLYSTGPGGVWIIAPSGEPLGLIGVPEAASNLAWGGTDGRTLFITACTSVYWLDTR